MAAFLYIGSGARVCAQSSPNVEAAGIAPQATAAPSIQVAATVPIVIARTGDSAVATFTRTGGDTSKKLFVYYTVRGSAKDGVDYHFINGRLKIKPGKDSARLSVTPIFARSGGGLKTIKIRVRPNPVYSAGTNDKVTLYVNYGG